MMRVRRRLRDLYIAPIAIALMAVILINQWLANITPSLARGIAQVWNFIGPALSTKYFKLEAVPSLGWRDLVFTTAGTIAVLLVLWLIALWLYPETDAQPSEP